MKLTRTLFLAGLVGVLAAPGMLYAHCGHCEMDKAKSESKDKMTDQDPLAAMTQALGLTADQQAKIKAIKEESHKQMEALHQDTHAKVSAVLTKDQQAKHEKMPKSCAMCKHCKGDKDDKDDHTHKK